MIADRIQKVEISSASGEATSDGVGIRVAERRQDAERQARTAS